MTPLSKRLIIALSISAAINLLCAGLFVGTWIHHFRARAQHLHAEPWSGQRDPSARAERRHGQGPFVGILAAHRDEMAARRRDTMDARKAVADSLEHEPFDAAGLDRALVALRAQTAKTQELVHQSVEQVARDGDADARKKLARGFQRSGAPH